MFEAIRFNDDTLTDKWVTNNHREDNDITVEIQNEDGSTLFVNLKKYLWFYSIDESTYTALTQNDLNNLINKVNDYICVKHTGTERFYHYTYATKDEIESTGLLASEGEHSALADGIYVFSYSNSTPSKHMPDEGNYIDIDYTGTYFECLYDPYPAHEGNLLIGKDGFEYSDDRTTRKRTNFSKLFTEYLLPIYKITTNLVYHEVN